MEIGNWNVRKIKVARSRGGVLATCRYHDNLIDRVPGVVEHAEHIQKLCRSSHESAFDADELAELQSHRGYYCDVQSLHSEDAITWSVFGTVGHSEEASRVRWVRELFKLLQLYREPEHCEIALWRRIPHPETLDRSGPEIDFSIITECTVILGESKWLGDITGNQGRSKNKDQIELRMEYLRHYRQTISYWPRSEPWPVFKNTAVVLVTLDPLEYTIQDEYEGVEFRNVTWKQICSMKSHPLADEVGRYYRWKLLHSQRKQKDSVKK